jgi:hypothetical protein
MCLQHGQLLREIRTRYAGLFDRLHELLSDCLWRVDRCVNSIVSGQVLYSLLSLLIVNNLY